MIRPPVLLAALALLPSACSVTTRSAQPQAGSADLNTKGIRVESSAEAPPSSKVADMVQEVLPSVVNVRVRGIGEDQFGGIGETRGEGSGVVIDRQGIIVTNNHVVADATDVRVVFPSTGRRLEGTVLGTVPERDLAVVKVDATNLQPIEIGDSSKLLPGDSVVAIGFPLGLGVTVTRGIVSATTRTIKVPNSQGSTDTFEGLLQTDAAINPGNSGGPLVDLNGRLVGINSAAAQAGAAENIGFAIAIDRALPIINQILSSPGEKRAWMGVFLQEVYPGLASQLGVPADTTGAAVVEVAPGSPAEDAGLEAGDVITGIDGSPLSSDQELIELIAEHRPGDEISLEVLDANGSSTVGLTLAPRPPSL
jgi:S1-C subfamily serine protease